MALQDPAHPPCAPSPATHENELLTSSITQTLSGSPEKDAESTLPDPVSCASPSLQTCSNPPAEEWHGPSLELVTYELELDTGSCKVKQLYDHRITPPMWDANVNHIHDLG